MTISLVTLLDTFLTWLNKTNQVIDVANRVTEGQLNTSGTITISNPTLLNGGISLNIANGMIRGDGGLISNVNTSGFVSGSITNQKLQNSSIRIVSNSTSLVVSGGNVANLGDTVFLDIGALTSSLLDTSISNIASANAVNTLYALTSAAAANSSNAGGGYWKGNRGSIGSQTNKNDIFRVSYNFLGQNVTIETGENAQATGPLTINTGVYLIVNSNARLVIV